MSSQIPKHTDDLTGRAFGRWLVISYAGVIREHSSWLCRCECGTERILAGHRLKSGTTRSCGCWQKENARALNTKHGMWRSTEYRIWAGLVNRCTNPSNPDYPNYGGRHIQVCDRWRQDFRNFYADMGPRPSSKHSIDRIDNDGPYSPENCRWATNAEQCRNARYNHQVTYNGKTQAVIDWANEIGISIQALNWRLKHWSVERSLTEPIEVYQKRK